MAVSPSGEERNRRKKSDRKAMLACRSLFKRRKVSLTMHPYLSEHQRHQHKAPGGRLQRFLLTLILLSLSAIIVCLLVIGQLWHLPPTPEQHPTPTATLAQ